MLGRILTMVLTIAVAGSTALAKSPTDNDELRRLAAQAVTAEGPSADRAIVELRSRGPEALDTLVAMLRDMTSRPVSRTKAPSDEALAAERERIVKMETVIDRVAGQRYAHISGLYWYTDLDAAKAAAAESGLPILSLRMLGNLTDEFSCANSRFFRTTLYSNAHIAYQLRTRFVLHWKSVRPVPRVTIDFGDGRKLQRTLTGNSAHYVLAGDGTPLDVLPGLYGPQQFLAWLKDVQKLHGELKSLEADDRQERLRAYHAAHRMNIVRQWAADLAAVTGVAEGAARFAADPQRLSQAMTDDLWHQIALAESHRVELDESSRAIIRRENTSAARAGNLSVTKAKVEDPILRLVRTLQVTIGLDSVRNEYTLHRLAHEWFADGRAPSDVERLNERVYAELFLTPASDPWLGLASPDTYTALENAGIVAAP